MTVDTSKMTKNPYPPRSGPWYSWKIIEEQNLDIPEFDCFLSTQAGLNGQDSRAMFLVCTHPDCLIGEGRYAIFWQKQLPHHCLPETAVLLRAAHLATHGKKD